MDAKTIRTRLQELAFLNSKATIWFKASSAKHASANGNGAAPTESADDGWEKLHYSGGLQEYVQHLNRDNSPMHEPVFIRDEVSRLSMLVLAVASCTVAIVYRPDKPLPTAQNASLLSHLAWYLPFSEEELRQSKRLCRPLPILWTRRLVQRRNLIGPSALCACLAGCP